MATPKGNKPPDYDTFWQDTLEELSRYPMAPEIEPIPLRTADFATMYGVRLTSLGPYRVFAYLSIPSGTPPFPAVFYLPNYGSVVQPMPGVTNEMRARYITFSLAVRGQRNADQPFEASFPGLLTEGIDDPSTYIFRGIVADCFRGLEYLLSRPEVDPNRVAAEGNDLALIIAGWSGRVTHVISTPTLFHRAAELAPATTAYPLQELNDYIRHRPNKKRKVTTSLAYLDPLWCASCVQATTLIMGGAEDEALNLQTLQPLMQELGQKGSLHESEHSGYKNGVFAQEWLATQFGFSEAILPEHWK